MIEEGLFRGRVHLHFHLQDVITIKQLQILTVSQMDSCFSSVLVNTKL